MKRRLSRGPWGTVVCWPQLSARASLFSSTASHRAPQTQAGLVGKSWRGLTPLQAVGQSASPESTPMREGASGPQPSMGGAMSSFRKGSNHRWLSLEAPHPTEGVRRWEPVTSVCKRQGRFGAGQRPWSCGKAPEALKTQLSASSLLRE